MDTARALELVWMEAERSSQAVVAAEIEVSPSALTRWKQGETPKGERRRKLLTWAEKTSAIRARAATPIGPTGPIGAPPSFEGTHRGPRGGIADAPVADYWRGVLYAVAAMSDTVGRLTREASASPGLFNAPASPLGDTAGIDAAADENAPGAGVTLNATPDVPPEQGNQRKVQ